MNDFAKAVENAQKLPELPEDEDWRIPNAFKGEDPLKLVSRVITHDADQVPGGVNYDYKYNCARLLIGQILSGSENGMPTFDDVDDSARLTEIMNKSLQAKAIIFKKETTFLKDGTVVIWLEWGEPTPQTKNVNNVLSINELMSPEPPDESEDSEDNNV
jgi:hypothetical protein